MLIFAFLGGNRWCSLCAESDTTSSNSLHCSMRLSLRKLIWRSDGSTSLQQAHGCWKDRHGLISMKVKAYKKPVPYRMQA